MNFTCNECNDTGSRDKLGTYLDCNACGTASIRRDLNDFVKSLGPTHPEDVALAIHQRALAMAPKQEAPGQKSVGMVAKSSFASHKVLVATTQLDDVPLGTKLYLAAPAVANGALTDADILTIIWKYSSFISVGNCSSTQFDCQADTLNCIRAILAAAGPDAALVKALESAPLESALAIINNEADPDEYAAPLEFIRAALSGAKGN